MKSNEKCGCHVSNLRKVSIGWEETGRYPTVTRKLALCFRHRLRVYKLSSAWIPHIAQNMYLNVVWLI
jgi:hypothetical protein